MNNDAKRRNELWGSLALSQTALIFFLSKINCVPFIQDTQVGMGNEPLKKWDLNFEGHKKAIQKFGQPKWGMFGIPPYLNFNILPT